MLDFAKLRGYGGNPFIVCYTEGIYADSACEIYIFFAVRIFQRRAFSLNEHNGVSAICAHYVFIVKIYKLLIFFCDVNISHLIIASLS
jgi:hypothetical protein